MADEQTLAEMVTQTLQDAGFTRHRPAYQGNPEHPGFRLLVLEGGPYGGKTVRVWHEPAGEHEQQHAHAYLAALRQNPALQDVILTITEPEEQVS